MVQHWVLYLPKKADEYEVELGTRSIEAGEERSLLAPDASHMQDFPRFVTS